MSDNELKDYQPAKAIVNKPLQWTDLALSEQVKTLRFFRDKDNNILAMPVVFFDPTQPGLNVLPMGRVGISDPAALSTYARVFGLPNAGWPDATIGLITHSTQMLLRGDVLATTRLEGQHTPTIFRYITAIVNVGESVAFWTPVAGNRVHIMGGYIGLTKEAACAGAEFVELHDAGALIPGTHFQISSGALVTTGQVILLPFNFPGNGYRSPAINGVIRLNLNGALTAGNAFANVWGYEEVG